MLKKEKNNLQTAYFAAGCFWHVEERFSKLPGIIETKVGYMGGKVANPSYEMVCSNKTGHAETTKVVFDPKKLSYENLVRFFFEMHNPTTLNRQGMDVGTQYRSVIFYTDESQKQIAQKVKEELDKKKIWKHIVTEIVPAEKFYLAEEYHQKYLEKQ
jgi:methionine-S-sulfoxide reductase